MNKADVLALLLQYLSDILCHNDFVPELISLIAGSGYELKFFGMLNARLLVLSSLGVQATVTKEFEPLTDGLYSMHLAGRDFNIRIIYAFLQNRQPVLLSAFHEREGKKKTDYSSYIPVAKNRLLQMRKENDNGK
jgi:hypothetical protein